MSKYFFVKKEVLIKKYPEAKKVSQELVLVATEASAAELAKHLGVTKSVIGSEARTSSRLNYKGKIIQVKVPSESENESSEDEISQSSERLRIEKSPELELENQPDQSTSGEVKVEPIQTVSEKYLIQRVLLNSNRLLFMFFIFLQN